ncbi:MAG: DUF134 domain-containing protein [Candidatus Izemoplasmatales bacterium]|jgi:predicted DNA-binding protein (UPF0251 family)|nr:DUF134 domain-containing protein [Candidatus Izemoplasmatales bacterium]
MPRPKLLRRVCFLPEYNSFASQEIKSEQLETIIMTVEEFESIRLIDMDDFDQEKAAIALGVSRGTLQRIYHEAKKKVAEMLICGKKLVIKEGHYRLCSHPEHWHRKRCSLSPDSCGEKY